MARLLRIRASRSQGRCETGQRDLAIQGGAVWYKPGSSNAEEAQYTRDGSFTLDVEGYIVSNDGQRLKSTGGDFRVPRQAQNDAGDAVF